MHAIGAVTILGLVLHHALSAGRYSEDATLIAFWLALATLGALSLIYAFIFLPIRMLKRPFRLVLKEKQGEGKWLLTFEPEGFEPKQFRKGQFVWLMFDSPFSILEHPFTIASDSTERSRISFFIVE